MSMEHHYRRMHRCCNRTSTALRLQNKCHYTSNKPPSISLKEKSAVGVKCIITFHQVGMAIEQIITSHVSSRLKYMETITKVNE